MIRRIKGLYMFFMFGLFFLGILLVLVFVVPVLSVVAAIKGPRPGRMEPVQRFCMGLWLRGMCLGRQLCAEQPGGSPVPGASVIVANHPGLFDVLALIRDVPELSLMVKRSLVKSLPLGPVFRQSGYILAPDSSDLSTARGSLEQAMEQLAAGRRFMIFPEGTRSPKGGLHRFKAGAFKIASRAGVPIQPVLIRNVPPYLPHEDQWYLPPRGCSRMSIEFLEPMPPPARGGEAAAARSLEARYRELLGLEPA